MSPTSPAPNESASGKETPKSHIDRRTFLRTGSLGLAGASAASWLAQKPATAQQAPKTRLVTVKHANATDQRGAGDPALVRQMVDRAILELTGKDSLAEAWRTFVSPDDVVGIKLNLRAGKYLSTQSCVTDAIIAGLTAAGVPENNIIAWDAWTREFPRAGYTLNTSGQGVRYYASDKGREAPKGQRGRDGSREYLEPFYAAETVPIGDQKVQFTKILTEEITALINVPLIKDHSIAGVTCSMKNHYGSILKPRELHGNSCDPYLAELNAAPPIRDKTRLILVDGLRGIYNGGPYDKPQWRWRPNCIIAGTDTVAVDALALRILEEKRKQENMPPIGERAKHVATAAKIGLGTNKLDEVDHREIDLGAA